jgi:hypothetical protein
MAKAIYIATRINPYQLELKDLRPGDKIANKSVTKDLPIKGKAC